MIFVDFNQVCISNIIVAMNSYAQNLNFDENLLRSMILNSLRLYRKEFHEDYGELVICCDDVCSWRKEVFPFYKANRKKRRDVSKHDWGLIHSTINTVRTELEEYFPYPVVLVKNAEADDVIGVLVRCYSAKHLIISGDKDFLQLQTMKNVYQYAPVQKKWMRNSQPLQYLREQIVRGDSSDGVPNILSNDSDLVKGIRQKPITQKRLRKWLPDPESSIEDAETLTNYKRNQVLIDLSYTPADIEHQILYKYREQIDNPNTRTRVLTYMIKHRLKEMMLYLDEF